MQHAHQLAGDNDGVVALLRHAAVAADAMHADGEAVAGGQQRAFAYGDAALAEHRIVVQAIDFVAGKAREQPVFDHRRAAG
ncbi:hypothetical protein D3C73_1243790 [compost metagenome]